MAKIIAIYNNKGGVGKTTLALFLADFLSSISINKKKSRVLVIDFDPQASCSTAILGLEHVTGLVNNNLTLPKALQIKSKNNSEVNLKKYISTRKENNDKKTKKVRLGNLDVIVPDANMALEIDKKTSLKESLAFAGWIKKELKNKYDFIFVDLPGSLSEINSFSLIGVFLAEYFIIPVEPNRINTNSIPPTLKMITSIEKWKEGGKHKLLGFVLNKTDRRSRQYKLHKDELMQFANIAGCKIYNNVLPPTPKIADAADDSISYITLSGRYDSYYDNVRKLVLEIATDLGFTAKSKR